MAERYRRERYLKKIRPFVDDKGLYRRPRFDVGYLKLMEMMAQNGGLV